MICKVTSSVITHKIKQLTKNIGGIENARFTTPLVALAFIKKAMLPNVTHFPSINTVYRSTISFIYLINYHVHHEFQALEKSVVHINYLTDRLII